MSSVIKKPKIILDCDPGHDDAVAIIFAAKHCDVLGITTVSGNVSLDLTTHNALIVTQIIRADIPVYSGADRPLIAEAVHAPDIHGESGLGGPKLPELTKELAGTNAVQFIIDTVRAQKDKDLWLVATGPLTNIALAIRTAPDILDKIAGISLMGGSNSFGNRTPAAEFNIIADPEAAEIVFSSGTKILMSGLNLTHQFGVLREDIAKIREISSTVSEFVADMLEFFASMYEQRYFGEFNGPLHDPCAIMVLSNPELFEFASRNVEVELTGTYTRGMTVVDERHVKTELKQNVELVLTIDRQKAMDLLIDTIADY